MLDLISVNFNVINKFNGFIALIFETYFGFCATIHNYIKKQLKKTLVTEKYLPDQISFKKIIVKLQKAENTKQWQSINWVNKKGNYVNKQSFNTVNF